MKHIYLTSEAALITKVTQNGDCQEVEWECGREWDRTTTDFAWPGKVELQDDGTIGHGWLFISGADVKVGDLIPLKPEEQAEKKQRRKTMSNCNETIAEAAAKIDGQLDEPRDITADERRMLAEAGCSENAVDGAKVVAEKVGGAKLYDLGSGYGFAIEGETGDIIADLDWAEALVQWS